MFKQIISPQRLAALLGNPQPTPAQAEVIAAPLGPRLIVAGAGAGKTATMVSRAVYLVANGIVRPDQILGLTFTRKATQQLQRKLRHAFLQLAQDNAITRDIDPTGQLARLLVDTQPTALTYDAYAGELIREYGLLIPTEPGLRIISETECYAIADRVVTEYAEDFKLFSNVKVPAVVERLLKLAGEMNSHQVDPEELREETRAFISAAEELEVVSGKKLSDEAYKVLNAQLDRLQYLPLLERLKEEFQRLGVTTFDQQMTWAARLAEQTPQVGASQRERYRVIMLDEYQDTSHSQRVLLRSLFGGGADPELVVNAVGDPMQAIYGWRGATSANLAAFVHDFPTSEGPAPKSELVTSFRNPPGVLAMANQVAQEVLGPPGPNRLVAPLSSDDETAAEDIRLGWFNTADEEQDFVADAMAQGYHAAQAAGRPFTGAILVRKNSQSQPFAEALAARGIPCEIVGLSGLLHVPEVADLVALATMLVRPGDTQAALRILSGPMVGLSVRDLQRLARRAKQLAGKQRSEQLQSSDPLEQLQNEIIGTVPAADEEMVGLTDALADLSDWAELSPEGRRRAEALSQLLGGLRRYSLTKPLTDLFVDIERRSGLRTEVLARANPYGEGAVGTVHLDRFADYVASYAAIPGANLSQLLEYFELAKDEEKGLELGEVAVQADRVQILTVHKAKGLEWDIVAVPHAEYSTSSTNTYLKSTDIIPADLRGDADSIELFELPEDAIKVSDFPKACKDYTARVKSAESEEATRLFYVALTRSARSLMISSSAAAKSLYPPFVKLKESYPQWVVHWPSPEEEAAADKPADIPVTGEFPRQIANAKVLAGAARVQAALAELPPLAPGDGATRWEADVTALIEEHRAQRAPLLDVVLPAELTASDLVSLGGDAAQFARRLRRPVPFKPNAYAKRGTAFHQWVEDRFGGASLLDEEQLPGIDEEVIPAAELEHLKERFLASPWANRTPHYVELPFEVALGGRLIRGRMDAVFYDQQEKQWQILDWKTGRPPTGEDRRTAEIQLAIYRLALQEKLRQEGKTAEDVRAGFHYVGWNETLWPTRLPARTELAQLLAGTERR